ncbi:MAG: hypothetical protein KIT65_11275 [Xanthobacteraceae bacterium]|nr:hypothetical protein [Xanthobacteraceae bacterium]
MKTVCDRRCHAFAARAERGTAMAECAAALAAHAVALALRDGSRVAQTAVGIGDQNRATGDAAPFARASGARIAVFGGMQENAERVVAVLERKKNHGLAAAGRKHAHRKAFVFAERKLHAHLHAAHAAAQLDAVARNSDLAAAVIGGRIGCGDRNREAERIEPEQRTRSFPRNTGCACLTPQCLHSPPDFSGRYREHGTRGRSAGLRIWVNLF